ncbi:MAG TPA: hypothetical protein VMS71_07320 [Candidatus Acidoferrum sp.]|nr:hypothetical protein [Candidatus Acidoferrum sp.]
MTKRMYLGAIVALVAATILAALPAQVAAEDFLRNVTHMDGFEVMGNKQPARDDTTSFWIGTDRMAMVKGGKVAALLDAKGGLLYVFDNANNQYSSIKISDISATVDSISAAANSNDTTEEGQQKKMIANMMASTKVTVTPTQETKKIRNWTARKYLIDQSMPMIDTKITAWTTKDIKIDYTQIQLLTNAFKASTPGFGKVLEEFKKINGLPVSITSESAVMGQTVKTTTDLIEYAQKPAPKGIFEIPTGYKQVESLPMNMRGM